MMQFEISPETSHSIIKVIGVGGGGSNAVNHMFRQGIKGVDFIVCNTDKQALDVSPVPMKIQLGTNLTKGLGAGSIPEMGRNSALETIDEVKNFLSDGTQMVFITAGMGGGTGTGAAPIIASVAKEMGILTVGIVTLPFVFEGKKRKMQAEQGLEEMKKYVDTLLVICNDKLREMYGNLKMIEAFGHADNVLTGAAKSIAEIISINLHINVDFNDVKTVMKDSGVAIMGTASASGDRRAIKAVEEALNSPLLNDNDIRGARHVLLNIMSGNDDITMDEFGEITDYIQEASGYTAELITGYGIDPSLGDNVNVTIIATGFQVNSPRGFEPPKKEEKQISILDDIQNTPSVQASIPVIEISPKSEEEKEIEKKIIDSIEPYLIEQKLEETPILSNEISSTSEISEINEEMQSNSNEEIKAENLNENSFEFIQEISNLSNERLEEVTENHIEFVDDNSFPTSEIQSEPLFFEIEKPEMRMEEEKELSMEELAKLEREERIKAAQERIKKLKDISLKIKSPEGLSELEKEPSFVRQNIQLNDSNYSTENTISRFTLSENDEKKMEIKPNNSFLHDNVD